MNHLTLLRGRIEVTSRVLVQLWSQTTTYTLPCSDSNTILQLKPATNCLSIFTRGPNSPPFCCAYSWRAKSTISMTSCWSCRSCQLRLEQPPTMTGESSSTSEVQVRARSATNSSKILFMCAFVQKMYYKPQTLPQLNYRPQTFPKTLSPHHLIQTNTTYLAHIDPTRSDRGQIGQRRALKLQGLRPEGNP